MQETLQITKDNAIKAWNNGCGDVKKVLENLFGSESFKPKSIMDQVKTFEDACRILNLDPVTVLGVGLSPDELAYRKLKVIARALNQDWTPDWTNANQYKYYPWFDLSSGSGLRYFGCDVRRSGSSVGSRLCFKSRELAEYAGTQFIDIYTDFFIK